MTIRCPHCSQAVSFDSENAGQAMTCPNCEKPFTMPEWDAPPAVVTRDDQPAPPPQPQFIFQPMPVYVSDGRTSAGVAALLSLLVPGLGQVIQGRPVAALIFFVFFLVSVGLSFFIIGIPLLIICWICAVLDAASN